MADKRDSTHLPEEPPSAKRSRVLKAPEGFQTAAKTPIKRAVFSMPVFETAFSEQEIPSPASRTKRTRPLSTGVPKELQGEASTLKGKQAIPGKATHFTRSLFDASSPPREDGPIPQQGNPSTSSITNSKIIGRDSDTPSKKPVSVRQPPRPILPSVSKKTVSLKALAPPPAPVLVTPSKKPMSSKAFIPPPPPVASGSSPSKKDMRTITTTRVARATDPTTDSGTAELLSISLQQNGHTFIAPEDRELSRGIFFSPEKSDRGKRQKFIRNGLAERASSLISRSQTAFSLWQRETETTVRTPSRRLTPDLRLRIVKILHVIHQSDRFRTAPTPRSGLALCRTLDASDTDAESGDLRTVLFTFAPPSSTGARISTAEDFAVDQEVYIWRPWHMVDTPTQFHDTSALLCTRFYFIRTAK